MATTPCPCGLPYEDVRDSKLVTSVQLTNGTTTLYWTTSMQYFYCNTLPLSPTTHTVQTLHSGCLQEDKVCYREKPGLSVVGQVEVGLVGLHVGSEYEMKGEILTFLTTGRAGTRYRRTFRHYRSSRSRVPSNRAPWQLWVLFPKLIHFLGPSSQKKKLIFSVAL